MWGGRGGGPAAVDSAAAEGQKPKQSVHDRDRGCCANGRSRYRRRTRRGHADKRMEFFVDGHRGRR